MRVFRVCAATTCGVTLIDVHHGGPYQRGVPVIRGPRLAWMQQVLAEKTAEIVVPPAARVVALRDATVRGPGVITLPGDRIVRESLINCEGEAVVAGLRRLPGADEFAAEPEFAEGAALPDGTYVLLKQMWDMNYGHWLIEGLPRVGLLEEAVDFSACRFLVSAQLPAMHAVFVDSLSVFGIRPDQIVVTDGAPVFAENLIYPLPMTVQPWVKAPLAVRILEDVGARVRATVGGAVGGERLVVRRLAESRRPLRNQQAIQDLLQGRGYQVVTPGEMSFAAQVLAFSNARCIVGTLGAECANMVFAPPGVRFLGLAPSHMQDDFFYDLVSLKGGAYFSLHGEAEDEAAGMNSGFSVEMGEVLDLLGVLEG